MHLLDNSGHTGEDTKRLERQGQRMKCAQCQKLGASAKIITYCHKEPRRLYVVPMILHLLSTAHWIWMMKTDDYFKMCIFQLYCMTSGEMIWLLAMPKDIQNPTINTKLLHSGPLASQEKDFEDRITICFL